MGQIIQMLDYLRNAVTGMGTRRDPRAASAYCPAPYLSAAEIDAAYRGSGLLRKIVQIPALDMVREWRDWKLSADEITAIEAEERRLGIREKVRQAEALRGLGGGALILVTAGDHASELRPDAIRRGGLVAVNVVNRWQITGVDWIEDLANPGYGTPRAWRINSGGNAGEIHPSRVVCFRADTAGALLGVASQEQAFWGESVVAQVLDAVKDSDTARASFAALLQKAKSVRIGIPRLMDLVSTDDGSKWLNERLAILATGEGIHNAVVFDAGDEDGKGGETVTDAQYDFAGAKDVLDAFAQFVSAISDIPASRLLGRAAEGMNSSGDSQQKDWNKMVAARQTLDLQPCMDQLDQFLVPSALGTRPDAAQWYEWAPLDTPSQADEATRFKTFAEAMEKFQGMNVVPDVVFNEAAQSVLIDNGWMPALEAALARLPDGERTGAETDQVTA